MFTVFGDKNLDLAATRITVSNELGQQETHFIPSETFRRRMAVFFFKNDSGNPQLDWLQYGVTELLVQDLRLDPFVLANSPWSNYGDGFYSRMRRAGFNDGLDVPLTLMREIANEANRQYFVEGSLDRKDTDYVLTARIWDTQTLEQLTELETSGADIYAGADHLSKDIRRALDVPASSKLRDSGDLDGAEQHYRQALLLQNAPVRPTLKLAIIASRKGDIPAARKLLAEAEQFAQTPTDKTLVRQGVTLLEFRLGRIREAIRQTYAQEEFLRQSQGLLGITLSVYTPLIDFYVILGEFDSARGALDTAKGMLSPPADKFMSFSAAVINAKQHDIDAARASLLEAREVIDQFKLKFLESQFNLVEAIISEELGDFRSTADHCMKAIEQIDQTVVANGLQIGIAQIYAQMAKAQIKSGDLGAAEKSIGTGFRLDPSEPMLWVEKARLQQARDIPQLALASVNYALAIWKDADDDYDAAREARVLAAELQAE